MYIWLWICAGIIYKISGIFVKNVQFAPILYVENYKLWGYNLSVSDLTTKLPRKVGRLKREIGKNRSAKRRKQ